MDINNMSRDELVTALKNILIECKADFQGNIDRGMFGITYISFQKGHWYYVQSDDGGMCFFDDNNEAVVEYYFIDRPRCFPTDYEIKQEVQRIKMEKATLEMEQHSMQMVRDFKNEYNIDLNDMPF